MDKNKQYLSIIVVLSVTVLLVVISLILANTGITGMVPGQGNGPPTDHPGQGQGVPFANGGGEPPCEDPCEGVDTSKCDQLQANCPNICASKGAHAWAVTRNWAIADEGGDPACADNPTSVYIESCTITTGDAEDPTVCADVICACYFC
jgi:hypothetical protein